MTIEERALEYARHDFGLVAEGKAIGYAVGATSQRKIDINKACEWIRNNWRSYIDKDKDGEIRFGGWENDLRKAMEE